MPERFLMTWVWVRPPMTAVSPSSTSSWLSARRLVEEEAEVAADDVQPRLLGVHGHADLAIARDVRGDARE